MRKFKTVNELVNSLKPDYPVYCIRTEEIKKSVDGLKAWRAKIENNIRELAEKKLYEIDVNINKLKKDNNK